MSDESMSDLPRGWSDLIKALALLAKGRAEGTSPFHCEHDELTVMADPAAFTADELEQLNAWGFFAGADGTFHSYRYGSA